MQCLFSESHGLHLGELMRDSLPFTARFQLGKNMWFHYIQIDQIGHLAFDGPHFPAVKMK